jgi:ABC-type multidrug transport system fused ATPase/permease subunit
VAEETLTAIKVVSSFAREERELRKFARNSRETTEVAKKASATMALMVGIMKFAIFFFYSYTLYVGSFFIEYSVSDYNGRIYDQ